MQMPSDIFFFIVEKEIFSFIHMGGMCHVVFRYQSEACHLDLRLIAFFSTKIASSRKKASRKTKDTKAEAMPLIANPTSPSRRMEQETAYVRPQMTRAKGK